MAGQNIPKGFRFAALAGGIKQSGKPDLALIVSDAPASGAGVFTRNQVVAAPVRLTRSMMARQQCQAILINSGNANACTGEQGMAVARETRRLAAAQLQLEDHLVAVASTGVIGVQLPLEPFQSGIPKLVATLRPDAADEVAEAIITTDIFTKTASVCVPGEQGYRILGIAKGAGMIHPNMATMLAFVLTDAEVEAQLLDTVLRSAVAKSFNSISVDGDTSTNDMVLLLANGSAPGAQIRSGTAAAETFSRHLEQVLLDLAKMIVRDGEGATKLVHIRVVGAESEADACTVARSVATSPLVKTAFFGEDANWGRIIAAVGYSGANLDQDKIDIDFDAVPMARNGMSVGTDQEAAATKVLQQDEFVVTINLNLGTAEAGYYTSDLSYDYVKTNADYRT